MEKFNTIINRRGTNSVKWDMYSENDLLHAWVADMDFASPKEIQDALLHRVEHGVFGYTFSGDNVRNAIKAWMQKRHKWHIKKDWIVFQSGVVPSLSSAIQAFTKQNDRILIQTPVYPPTFDMVTLNGRELANSPLVKQNGTYEMDFADLERHFQQGVAMMVLCSPHNPVGRVWTKPELERLGELCERYDVLVVSDEIHSDIILKGHVHIPFAALPSLSKRTITCIAPSKTFNIAGLQAAAVIIENEQLRKPFSDVLRRQGFHALNMFASTAMEAAYTQCENWLEDLLLYLEENVRFACSYIEKELPELTVYRPEGTYLLWIDCQKLNLPRKERLSLLQRQGKIVVEPGEKFGFGGEHFIRLNLGCPKAMLKDVLAGLKKAVFFHMNSQKA
ncbi:MAG: MalY/PatB family protein [Ectobacillus sp.]